MTPKLRCFSVLVGLAILTLPTTRAQSGELLLRPLSFQSLSLDKARTVSADFFVDNHDRDPLGIDVFDVGFRFRYLAGDKTELFVSATVNRVVALPETPAIPSSPRDLIFAGASRAVPSLFVGEHPYLDKRGNARFSAFIHGPITLGMTRTLRRDGLAFGVSGALTIPMAGSLNALRSGAGSGRPDFTITGLASRSVLGGTAHGRLGFTRTGKGSWPDRSFSVSGTAVQVTETHVPIGNRLDAGVAWMRPISGTLAAGMEARMTREFVGEERIDAISPVDVVLGIHKRFGRFTASAALLSHFRALPSGELRANPLAGAVDLSNVAAGDRNAFLSSLGLNAVTSRLRDGAHIVVIDAVATTLPAGALRINPTYSIRSEHNLGYIFNVSFRP